MQVTPNHDLPYPDQSDSIDVAGDISALALAVDSALSSAGGKVVGEIFAWWDNDLSQPPPTGTLRCDGQIFNTVDYPLLGELLGSNTAPDLRGRFLRMGDADFPNLTKAGTANATPVTHTHAMGAHSHSIPNHAHTMPAHKHTMGTHKHTMGTHSHSINHDHPNPTTSSDTHNHSVAINSGLAVVYQGGGGPLGLADGNVWGGVYGNPLNVGALNGSSGNDTHNHTVDIANFSGTSGSTDPGDTSSVDPGDTSNTDPGDTNSKTGLNANPTDSGASGSAGSSGTNANLPPFISVTYLIQAV